MRPPALTLLRQAPTNPILCRGFSGLRHNNLRRPILQPLDIRIPSERHIHPFAIMIVKQSAKLLAMFGGRRFRLWWKSLPPDKRRHFMGRIREHKAKIALATAGFGVALGVYYYTHLQITPITGRVRFIAFNEEQQKKLNEVTRDAQYELVKDHLLPSKHPHVKRVSRVARRLLDANKDIEEIFSKEWSVCVINSPTENAFVGPSGQICVFLGMLGVCENDDQLGCVLAHEISHAVLNHGAELMSYTSFLDLFVIIGLAAIWAIMPTDIVAIITHWLFNKVCALTLELPYSRLIETEADSVGLELAAKACFDVRESSAFWAKMSLMRELQGEEPLPEFLSTHPDSAKRSEALDAMMHTAFSTRVDRRCPPLPRKDPRLSVEDLRNQITALKKWREANREGVILIPVSRP
ncbi:metalloendopeptidase OMA1, mitochondrial [Galendromus occidentalis]|uniref:Metalloendopeptidase OMA1, mitochondrial n=1 Tax=Galendromus occidentalis TaxID=34638 RepID=A0AAJ6VZ17_9ACAR|nr:metalloendopeptidase OMA1, mitochondrial [Galendromus occidentalis]